MSPSKIFVNLNPTDFTFSLVKLLAVLGGLIWGLYHPMSPSDKIFFFILVVIFFVYTVVLYLCVFRFSNQASSLYLFELIIDLIFLSFIMPITGGFNSTFTLGFFLLAAVHSFYYGLMASIGIAFLISIVYVFSCPQYLAQLHWTDIVLRVGFLSVLAVIMGYLSDRERHMHRQLVNAEQFAAMGLMSSQIAHAVRNPLSTISLNAELLSDEVKKSQGLDTREAETLISSIMNEVQRVNDVVEEHLKFMRRSKAEYRSCDVNLLLDSLIKFLEKEASRKGISFVKELEGNLPDVKIEESRLRQIMLNIVRNSFEAMPRGGQIRISTVKEKADIEITIEDTGIGISRENLRRIFEPFFTTKDVGTGLGLYIARDMVMESGGGISCESKINKGTKVKIRLPFAA